MYEVKVTQEIPYWDGNDETTMETTGPISEYIAGTFRAGHMARLFADALEQQIAEKSGFVSNAFTPQVTIWKVTEEKEKVQKYMKEDYDER